MKKIAVIKLLHELASRHNKKIVTLREISILTGESQASLGISFLRLSREGFVACVGRHWINLVNAPRLEDIAFVMRPVSYISFESALYKKNILSQAPLGKLSVATTGRPKNVKTPLGEIEFIHIKQDLYFGFDASRTALAEKALLDLIYVRKKKGLTPLPPVTLYLDELNHGLLKRFVKRFPQSVGVEVRDF
ncbi:MAG: hypothetical protein HQM16_00680 [Deltaproteobacteria bacterium]|nr:hypothetical protein [Deltaproteobacteria bacterium]